ncbi:DUF3618 domain-containing protein [Arsenicicoccus piscis]|uniref:DUF3618 domain-containing protein n=1 Tax=Arsenicicoccus piscis TaxID=673954 RepID=A0ABQ6HJF8_9MICO|nr:DUF3618 domain-containing protein [Arsenicicoccus piscis]MCH8628365.1 DUF3618 domain-containing protein [Arsenicicoccus piscis]GMA18639.1 hypothetical protein GCM10025862_06600 [Arsenicicoccus piscis]
MSDNQSVSHLESEIAASRARLASTIDEITFRAQPKQIVEHQKRQLVHGLKERYHSLMGTGQGATGSRFADDRGPSKVDEVKAKADELKAQATAKVDELKAQATTKVDEVKAKTGSDDPAVTRADYRAGSSSSGTDLAAQARATSDQARLKLDELTHDEYGELRTDRIALGLAALGAVLIGAGVAQRNS